MREIKFRAWHKERKTMVHFDIKTITKTPYPGFYYTEDLDGFYCELDDPNLYTDLMQYTGLKDSNGKEIYEGDIVEKWSHCSLLERLSPLYNRGVGYYKSLTTTVKWSEQGLNYNIYPHHDDSYWQVIGNIYENPELLGGDYDKTSCPIFKG